MTFKAQKAIVIYPEIRDKSHRSHDSLARLQEACGLAQAIQLEVVHQEVFGIRYVRPATIFGEGQLSLIQSHLSTLEAKLLIVDTALSPIQQRNLEKTLNCKVIDRTALILEIFGARARTAEGRLQVELASLSYQKSRLVRTWTHLDRQAGGLGFIGGPGETQIEIDRRLISQRITKIKKELEDVKRTRTLQRQARKRVPYPIVALVGYTNAGKSTLFNHLTQANVFAEDLLFATLDPTMRLVKLPSGKEIILSDTVGFISELPTSLIAAFQATLEEVLEADLILHVRDIAHMQTLKQQEDVIGILGELGLGPDFLETHLIEILNKIDLLSDRDVLKQSNNAFRTHPLSALTGEGIKELLLLIEEKLEIEYHDLELSLSSVQGAFLAWLYQHGHVYDRLDQEDKIHLKVKLSPQNWMRYQKLNHLTENK